MKEIKEDKKERKEPQVILQLPDDLSVGIMTALIHAHLQNIMEPDLGPQDEPETELFTTPQRKPTSTPTPTPAPTPTQSPVRPRTTKTNTPKQSPQQPRPQTTQSVKPKTTHIHRKHTDDLTDSEVDDQSLRHRDGYDLNPKTYGIRLFATEPSRYKHLNRLQLAHEITRGTIKWIYTDNSYQTRIHEQKITQHLHEGNMFIQPNMIEKKTTYIMGDFNAHHRLFGYTDTNAVGRGLASLISDGRLTHLGPHAPTFIRDNSSTTPDIVLANTQANLNHHITTDDVTSSDHLPVILTLSTNPIMVPTPPREILKHANWEGFKQALEHTHTPDLEGQPTHTIDHHLNQWYTDIQTAREANIPKTTFKTLVHYKETHRLKTLKIQYRHLRDLAETQGWNTELRSRYREIQRQLTNETKYMSNQHWETLTRELCNNIKDPKVFWLKYRRLLGSNRQTITYIYNTNRQKIDTAEGMEAVHREFWQQNFQISPAENTTFDPDTETEVTQTLQQLQHLILPSQTISLNTLSPDDPLSRPITPEDMRHAHTRTNNTTPGASNINKTHHATPPTHHARQTSPHFQRCPGNGILSLPFQESHARPNTQAGEATSRGDQLQADLLVGGTGSAIALAYEEIALSLANKHQTNIILRDVTKAFDKVWHDDRPTSGLGLISGPPSTSEVEYRRAASSRQPSTPSTPPHYHPQHPTATTQHTQTT
ncbi:hypothetical protein C7M84_012828 [Penaeus vannamei]|uniref:Endonuclease/exonuclease/phosphatase domain-containing protein n=1 Tax=Penaeus vannamei TaxID=6689 RepID=A0A423SXW9_PENVA|nr:hypothetical protein C7M84_012828 [Penaeus vannamei]